MQISDAEKVKFLSSLQGKVYGKVEKIVLIENPLITCRCAIVVNKILWYGVRLVTQFTYSETLNTAKICQEYNVNVMNDVVARLEDALNSKTPGASLMKTGLVSASDFFKISCYYHKTPLLHLLYQPGDVLVSNTPTPVDWILQHWAVYLGNDEIVHISTPGNIIEKDSVDNMEANRSLARLPWNNGQAKVLLHITIPCFTREEIIQRATAIIESGISLRVLATLGKH